MHAERERARSLLGVGRAEEAEEWCRRGITTDPGDREIRRILVLCLLRQGRDDEALDEAEAVLALEPADVASLSVVARARLENIDLPGAQAAVDEALALAPGAVEPHRVGLEVALLRADLAAARVHADAIGAARPGSAAYHNARGRIALQWRRPDEAIRHFEAAIAASPTDPALLSNLGIALEHAGRPSAAADAHARALGLDPRVDAGVHGVARSIGRYQAQVWALALGGVMAGVAGAAVTQVGWWLLAGVVLGLAIVMIGRRMARRTFGADRVAWARERRRATVSPTTRLIGWLGVATIAGTAALVMGAALSVDAGDSPWVGVMAGVGLTVALVAGGLMAVVLLVREIIRDRAKRRRERARRAAS